jgi:GTP-binding protein EngB required for normal cell division
MKILQQQQQQPNSPRERKREIEQQLEDRATIPLANDYFHHVDETKTDEPTREYHHQNPSAAWITQPPVWEPYRITAFEKIPSVIEKAKEVILTYRGTQIAPDLITLTIYSTTAGRELTLVDLPGLVQYQHTSDISLLSQVEQVVLEYVQNPRSILVPVISAPTNIHNSKVLQWCRTFDPNTERTIPVLTKPDLIDKGSENDVLQLLLMDETKTTKSNLEGQEEEEEGDINETTTTSSTSQTESQKSSFQFRHGFFMVKNRGQAALDNGSTIEDGLEEEKEFFANTTPWNNPALVGRTSNTKKTCLGIPALQTTLATLLSRLFRESLPDIINEINELYKAAETNLKAWGEVHETRSDQRRYYQQLVSTILSNVESSLSGKGGVRRSGRRKTTATNRMFETGVDDDYSEKAISGAARLHAACSVFMKEIQKGSLATVSTLVEGCPVIVSGTLEDIKGELVS